MEKLKDLQTIFLALNKMNRDEKYRLLIEHIGSHSDILVIEQHKNTEQRQLEQILCNIFVASTRRKPLGVQLREMSQPHLIIAGNARKYYYLYNVSEPSFKHE